MQRVWWWWREVVVHALALIGVLGRAGVVVQR